MHHAVQDASPGKMRSTRGKAALTQTELQLAGILQTLKQLSTPSGELQDCQIYLCRFAYHNIVQGLADHCSADKSRGPLCQGQPCAD